MVCLRFQFCSCLGLGGSSLAFSQSSVLIHGFGNQDGVQGCASQQLVTTDKEFNAIVPKSNGFAQSAHFHIVLSRGGQWHGIFQFIGIVHHLDSRCIFQDLSCFLEIHLLFGFQNYHFRVSPNGGDTNRRTGNGSFFGQRANFTRFPRHFHFFLGVSILLKFVNLWNDIEWQRVGKDFMLNVLFSVQIGLGSFLKFVHTRLTGSGTSLVSTHQDPFDTKCLD
mmetsp:Transcript_1706/g.2632  ORF Transcript_1706/g.2632 Transcript_1706/m.2632 type:complete len:222 (-) Transcript_1706:754-1419(-)